MVGERISLLENKLVQFAVNEIDNDELLEVTLCEMRNHTQLFGSIWNKQLKDTKTDLKTKLREHQSRLDTHEEEVQLAELELKKFNEEQMQEEAIFYKNNILLNNWRLQRIS